MKSMTSLLAGKVAIGVAVVAGVTMALLSSDAMAREDGDGATRLGTPSCGAPGLPDCPLQSWMKTNIVAPKSAGDSTLLAKNLGRISALAPSGSGWGADWKTIADGGSTAALKGDKDGVNAACTACHSKYRKAYREKYRENAVPN